MTMQTPFFGKRPNEVLNRNNGYAGHAGSTAPASQPQPAASQEAAAAPTPAGEAAANSASAAPAKEGASKLTVGPNIKLKGVEITDCDTLEVEGMVEATMDSRVMHIAAIGAFKGSAEVDFAEIHGAFNGDLTVREKLVIHAGGRVSGTIRYGRVVIEDGGQLSGDIQFGTAKPARDVQPTKVGLLTAA